MIGVYDKGKVGTVVETEILLVETKRKENGDGDKDDKEEEEEELVVYTRMVGSAVFIGQGNWGGPKGPSTAGVPAPEGRPDGVVEVQVGREAALLYR